MTELLLITLASFAISLTVTKEDGPFGVFEALRIRFYAQAPTAPNDKASSEDWSEYNAKFDRYEQARAAKRSVTATVAGILECPFCISWYVTLALVASFATGIDWYSLILWPASVGGVYVLLGWRR